MTATRSQSVVSALTRHPFRVAFLCACLLFGSAAFLGGLKVDNSLEVWFVEDDPALQSYRSFLDEFGNDEVVITILSADAPLFSEGRVDELVRVTDGLEQISGISRVVSLSNLPMADGGTTPLTPPQLEKLAAGTESGRRLVGEDGQTFVLFSWLEPSPDIDLRRGEIIDKLKESVANRMDPRSRVYHGGFGVVYDALNRATTSEGALFIGLSYLVVILAVLLVTRSLWWTLVAVGAITAANILMFGCMGLLQRPVNMVTIALPPLIMVLGVANVMHFSRHLGPGGRKGPSQFRDVLVPCVFNGLTTAGGFLALMAGSISVTRDYGLFAAVGVAGALLFSVAGTLLVFKRVTRGDAPPGPGRLAHWVASLMQFSIRHKQWVVGFVLLFAAISIPAIRTIVVDTYSINFLPTDHEVQVHSRAIEKKAGDYLPIEFVLSPRGNANMMSEANRDRLTAVQNKLKRLPRIGSAYSVVDLHSDMDTLQVGDVASALERQATGARLMSPDKRRIRLTVTTPMASAKKLDLVTQEVLQHIRQGMPEAIVEASGYMPLYGKIVDYVITDQVSSFAIAFLVIFGLIGVILRSWRLLLVAIPANLIPVATVLAVMGWFGIRLDVATVTVAAAVLGIIVDDTVHMLYHLKRKLGDGLSLEEAFASVGRKTGTAVVATSLVLCAGFGLIAFSSITSIAYTGLLTGTAVFAAMLADLFVLPATAGFLFPGPMRRS